MCFKSQLMSVKDFLYITFLFVFLGMVSCSGDTTEIDALYTDIDVAQERVSGVNIIYSDSARVRLSVRSPLMIRKQEKEKDVELFPNGLYVEFYQGNLRPETWLESDKGIRYPQEKRIYLQGNVKLYNNKQDKLETAELIWDEEKQQIGTEKFVRITQPEKGDTTYGFGFISDLQFNRFEIKRKLSGKIKEEMLKDFDD